MNKHWNTIKIIMVNWTIFALLAASGALLLQQKEVKSLEAELGMCRSQWEQLNTMLKEGKIVIQMEKGDLFK